MGTDFLDNLLKLLEPSPTIDIFNLGSKESSSPIIEFLRNKDFFQFAGGFISGDQTARIGGF